MSQIEISESSNSAILKADYLSAEPAKIGFNNPEQRTVPRVGTTYLSMSLMYNYGTEDRPAVGSFYLEGPELYSRSGIQEKTFEDKNDGPPSAVPVKNEIKGSGNPKKDFSVMASFELSDPKSAAYVDTMDKITARIGDILEGLRATHLQKLGRDKRNAKEIIKPLIYRPLNPTGEVIEGRSPSMFFKLINRGTAAMPEKTLFVDPQGVPIPWSKVTKVSMRFIPLLLFKTVYINGTTLVIQSEMVSAIVTDIKESINIGMQMDTLRYLQGADPSMIDRVRSQLSMLEVSRGNAGGSSSKVDSDSENPDDNGTTVSNIREPLTSNLTAAAPMRTMK